MEHFLRTYGYLGIILSTFFGAEEGVIISGFLAADGFFPLPGIIIASAVGGSLGDQIYFYLALRYGERILNRFERIRKSYPLAQRLLSQYGSGLVLASRFLAGIRIAVSVLCGILRMPPLTYSSLNFLSAILWASFYGLLSYRFGRALLEWLPQKQHAFLWVSLVVLLIVVIVMRFISRKAGEPFQKETPKI
ncbi:MAG TPA: DedA family protein [Acidobacteriota bacterium]|nr:DedA family protein [Acidobacteriota bacterium]